MKKASGATTTVEGMRKFVRDSSGVVTGDPFAFLAQDQFVRQKRIVKKSKTLFEGGVSPRQLFNALLPSGNAMLVDGQMLFKDSDGYFKYFDEISNDRLNELKKVTDTDLPVVKPKTLQDLPDAGKTARKLLLSKQGATRTAAKTLTKQSLRQTLGAVPLLGDLGVMLLDIYVFKEVPARAGFKTIGSIIGSVLGGILGGLIAAATGGTGVFLIPAIAILGGIGGDLLGGIIYDMVSNKYQTRTDGPFKRPPGDTSFRRS